MSLIPKTARTPLSLVRMAFLMESLVNRFPKLGKVESVLYLDKLIVNVHDTIKKRIKETQ